MNTKINQSNIRVAKRWLSTRARLGAHTRVRVAAVTGGLVAFLLLVSSGTALAAVQGYSVQDKTITTGMAVALNASGGVQKSSLSQADKTLGVVVNAQDNTVAVSGVGQQVYVATTGTSAVFVSDVNGAVHKGDLLGPSPIDGVLMRADNGAKGVLGVAMTDFPKTQTQPVTINKATGGTTVVKVANLRLNMDVRFAANNSPNTESFLQRIGEAVVHHQVSNAQTIVALAIMVLLIIVVGSTVYGAISSSIISLGRNPLAKKSIFQGLGQISGLVVLVIGLGVAAVYLVLWI